MIKLAPSILAADYADLRNEIRKIEEAGASYLHLDVMDGHFVPAISFGMCVITSLRKITDIVFDVHLMITDPERYIEDFAKCGADIITIHVEACSCIDETIDKIHALGLKASIAINPKTPVEKIIPYLDKVDMILVMSVEPGFGGQKYIDDCTQKIVQVRQMIEERHLDVDLEVDGGIGKGNVKMVVDAGANVIVAGSAVFNGDVQQNVNDIMNAIHAD
ncbi:MAG: ribulose-phosphate 3-epimerase [Lachnospiraceae bacterium]|nr:ribulose-phosphate 3-epimerase [Lachnospiraceae bacterium]